LQFELLKTNRRGLWAAESELWQRDVVQLRHPSVLDLPAQGPWFAAAATHSHPCRSERSPLDNPGCCRDL